MKLQIVPKARTDFVFRPIMDDDIPAFMLLYNLCFEDRPSEKYIRWRYFATPAGAAPTMLAFDQNICVASLMVRPTRMMLNGKEVMAGTGADAMTHPDYRGRGLFASLVEKCQELISNRGYQFFFAFPNDNSLSIGLLQLNWDHVCDISRWVRPLWVLGTSPLSGLAAATSLLWSSRATNRHRIALQAPEPDVIADLAARCERTKGICRVKRGREWFAWRYHTDSDRDYQWVAAYAGADLTGVGVWRFDATTRDAFLCELIGDPQSFSAVLNVVLRAAYRQKARVLSFPTNDPAHIPLLRANGFIRMSGHPFIVRSLTSQLLPANIHLAEAWRIHGGDFDNL